LICEQNCPPDYRYYGIPCPWVQIKALKILSLLNVPKDSRITNKINGILEIVLASAGVTEDENKNNTIYAILFEALGVIIHYRKTISFDLQNQALSLVILFMGVPEPNIR
jgi:AP-2 complex subunit alpha